MGNTFTYKTLQIADQQQKKNNHIINKICIIPLTFPDDGSSLIKAAALIKSLNPSLSGSPSLPQAGSFPGQIPPGPIARGCPLCDRSVYSYCSHKMVHDACCCNGGKSHFKDEYFILITNVLFILYFYFCFFFF